MCPKKCRKPAGTCIAPDNSVGESSTSSFSIYPQSVSESDCAMYDWQSYCCNCWPSRQQKKQCTYTQAHRQSQSAMSLTSMYTVFSLQLYRTLEQCSSKTICLLCCCQSSRELVITLRTTKVGIGMQQASQCGDTMPLDYCHHQILLL